MTVQRWRAPLVLLMLALCLASARAQVDDDDIGTTFKKPTAAEAAALREILDLPVPRALHQARGPFGRDLNQEALVAHFQRQESAARTLGDVPRLEAVIREAMRHLPYAEYPGKLGGLMLGQGRIAEGIALRRQAAQAANPFLRANIMAGLVCNLHEHDSSDAARAQAVEAQAQIERASPAATNAYQQNHLVRAAGMLATCLSQVELRAGRFVQAVATAESAAQHGRAALATMQNLPNPAQRLLTLSDAGIFLHNWVDACLAAGRLNDAERVLADSLRLATEMRLPAYFQARLYARTGSLRLHQREFALAERMHRRADSTMASLGAGALHPWRVAYARDVIEALIGQKRWPQALAELDRLDTAAGSDPDTRRSVALPLMRGLTYLGNGRSAEAVPLLRAVARTRAERLGAAHFQAAEASGLHGVALWRSGDAAGKANAVLLLKDAVRSYMAPANADYIENIGIRRDLRAMVFAAYLEAVAATPGEDAVSAIGAADWVRGGVVQEALGDAAVRAAAGTPELAEAVRQDQDAKNEILGLRRDLSGEVGAASAPQPGMVSRMRARIATLEADRTRLQAGIRNRFPEYEQLVRPTPPTVRDIATSLRPEQALLMLLPTADAIYAWAVTSDRPAAFARVALPEAELDTMVATLRRQLDLGGAGPVGRSFDSASASRLHDLLLAPLRGAWQGKTQLVVVAGGTLGQFPFAVLHTRAGAGFDASAPWLIKEAAIAQVPSVSAWLAIRAGSRLGSATQPFAGWGDPAFSSLVAAGPAPGTAVRAAMPIRAPVSDEAGGTDKGTGSAAGLSYGDIPPLPDTREELLAIAGLLGADPRADLKLGRDATRASVLAANRSGELARKRVLAFATHGLVAGDLPQLRQPALAMAATGNEERDPLAPLLTLDDVLTLKLNADWVVLSACNTAAADGRAEEALSGLARGFFYAGSRSLLVTHWSVESESARLLTTGTFQHQTAHPMAPKAESLRQSMLAVMALPRFSHPAFWAPYALVGDGGR